HRSVRDAEVEDRVSPLGLARQAPCGGITKNDTVSHYLTKCSKIRGQTTAKQNTMMTALRIEGYRGFDRFEINDLGRVNLLVRTNNSGKTSVLESLYLLASGGDTAAFWKTLWQRAE